MKKSNIAKILLISFVFLSLFNISSVNKPVLAEDYSQQSAIKKLCENPDDCPIKAPSDVFKILAKAVRYVYTIFFIVAIIFILVAAFNFLTAQGEPEKIKSARNQVFWAVIAIAIALISVGAAQIIKAFITP